MNQKISNDDLQNFVTSMKKELAVIEESDSSLDKRMALDTLYTLLDLLSRSIVSDNELSKKLDKIIELLESQTVSLKVLDEETRRKINIDPGFICKDDNKDVTEALIRLTRKEKPLIVERSETKE
jgi:hypothetical protein